MGWKGTLRSAGAIVREAEREAQRRQRQDEKAHKQYVKQQELATASSLVAEYDERVYALTHIHCDSMLDLFDWEAISKATMPAAPDRSSEREDQAVSMLLDYVPTFVDKLLRKETSRESTLEAAVIEAKLLDDEIHRTRMIEHATQCKEADEEKGLAERLLVGELDAFRDVLDRFGPFKSISDIGSSIQFGIERADDSPPSINSITVFAEIDVHGEQIIPSKRLSLLQSGRLSEKNMPLGAFYQLHQDYVCGCVLRIANELLALLPVSSVLVTAYDEILNTSTGHVERQAILSVIAPRETIASLNLSAADPSDVMENFLHRMSFRKTKGFAPVDAFETADLRQLDRPAGDP